MKGNEEYRNGEYMARCEKFNKKMKTNKKTDEKIKLFQGERYPKEIFEGVGNGKSWFGNDKNY